LFRTWADSVKYLPFLMSIGVGVSMNNARAALEGFFGGSSEFVRTPKFGVAGSGVDTSLSQKTAKNRLDRKRIQAWCEAAMTVYLGACVIYAIEMKAWFALFFMTLFFVGYAYVTLLTFYGYRMAASGAVERPAASAA
jgi:hypothetical protein